MDILDKRAAFSFEVFPPKTDVGMEKLCGEGGVLEKLYTLNPDYISCTYGAGGTNVGQEPGSAGQDCQGWQDHRCDHFTCIGNTKEGIKEQLQTYLDHGINICWPCGAICPSVGTGTGVTCTKPPSW